MATESYIQLPEDQTGKKVRTLELAVGSNTVHQEVLTLADNDGNLHSGFPKTAEGSIDAASNTSGLSVTLDTENRILVHWYVELSGSGDIKLYVSKDNTGWKEIMSKSGVTKWTDWDFIGFRYVKIEVPTTGIDVSILISAKGL